MKKIAAFTLTAGALVASQAALAHTTLTTNTAVEGATVYTNAAIGHGCPRKDGQGDSPVVANSVIFPDGVDSTVTVDGVATSDTADKYITWGGKIGHVLSNDVFSKSSVAYDANKSVVGNHSWNGRLPGKDVIGLVPLKIKGTYLVHSMTDRTKPVDDKNPEDDTPDSCAKSVKFKVAIADICKITPESGLKNNANVNYWTPAVGSKFDGVKGLFHSYDAPASFTITRDLTKYPLDQSCGAGHDVVISPSAAQLNRDMPIRGIWPAGR